MGIGKTGRKVVRVSGHRPYGGDPAVDQRSGISTESHMEMYRRLVKAGDVGMHNPPTERPPRKH